MDQSDELWTAHEADADRSVVTRDPGEVSTAGRTLRASTAGSATAERQVATVPVPSPAIPGAFGAIWAPRPPRAGRRLRTAVSLVLAITLLAGLGIVIKAAFLSDPGSYPAVVQPAHELVLDFQNSGVITSIDVQPGQRVTQGQVIATQDIQLDLLRLSYDQDVLAADQQSLAALQSSGAAQTQASQQASQTAARQRGLNIQLAQEQLSAAENELAAATTPQQQVQAQAAITEAQTKLALAENAQTSALSTSDASAVSGAQAAVARDLAQVAADQLLIQQGAITAPTAGVVAWVGGAVGDIAGPDGVVSPESSGTSVPVAPGFSLFPPAAQAPAVRSSSTFPPLVTLYDESSWDVVAEVPQSDIGAMHAGQRATVNLGGRGSLQATVTDVGLSPVVQDGAVSYDVLLVLDGRAANVIPGMAANVSIQPAKS